MNGLYRPYWEIKIDKVWGARIGEFNEKLRAEECDKDVVI